MQKENLEATQLPAASSVFIDPVNDIYHEEPGVSERTPLRDSGSLTSDRIVSVDGGTKHGKRAKSLRSSVFASEMNRQRWVADVGIRRTPRIIPSPFDSFLLGRWHGRWSGGGSSVDTAAFDFSPPPPLSSSPSQRGPVTDPPHLLAQSHNPLLSGAHGDSVSDGGGGSNSRRSEQVVTVFVESVPPVLLNAPPASSPPVTTPSSSTSSKVDSSSREPEQ